jgi:hypothetical protein
MFDENIEPMASEAVSALTVTKPDQSALWRLTFWVETKTSVEARN